MIFPNKLLKLDTIPVWVNESVKKIIKKATNKNPKTRYKTCSEMMLDITKAKSKVFDWCAVKNNEFYVKAKTEYRIVSDKKDFFYAEKKKHSDWKKDNSIIGSTNPNLVIKQVEKHLR